MLAATQVRRTITYPAQMSVVYVVRRWQRAYRKLPNGGAIGSPSSPSDLPKSKPGE